MAKIVWIHGYSTNSVIIASTRLLLTINLTELLRICKPTRQLHSSSDTSIFCIPIVRTHSLSQRSCVCVCVCVLRRQSGTLSLTKWGHSTPSHPSNYHLKLIFFSSPTDCVCGEGRGRAEGERGELVVYHKVWDIFSTYFVSCNGALCSEEAMAQKRTHYH